MRLRFKNGGQYTVAGLFLMTLLFAVGLGAGNSKIEKEQPIEKSLPITKVVIKKDGKEELWLRVIRVVDGDTFVVNINNKEEKIRLIGMDTPEVVDPRKPVQCFGEEASNKAKETLHNAYVRLESDATQSDRDTYGRLLRYAFLEDGTVFNEFMIKEGYAHEYTYQIPYQYQKSFKEAQRYARENKKGLWADGVCGGSS